MNISTLKTFNMHKQKKDEITTKNTETLDKPSKKVRLGTDIEQ